MKAQDKVSDSLLLLLLLVLKNKATFLTQERSDRQEKTRL